MAGFDEVLQIAISGGVRTVRGSIRLWNVTSESRTADRGMPWSRRTRAIVGTSPLSCAREAPPCFRRNASCSATSPARPWRTCSATRGGDSLSLAALGASVVGVDLSDEAVRYARALSERAGILARFEHADVYDWLADAGRRGRHFDAVYSSYGVVCWLPDLEAWAAGIAAILKPGGRFVLVEFHPAAEVFDEVWKPVRDYPVGGEPLRLDEGVEDYVGESRGSLTPAGFSNGVRGFENPEPCHLFRWGLGEVVTALAASGLRICALQEYPYFNGEGHFSGMRELLGGRMVPPKGVPAVPLMYGVRAERLKAVGG